MPRPGPGRAAGRTARAAARAPDAGTPGSARTRSGRDVQPGHQPAPDLAVAQLGEQATRQQQVHHHAGREIADPVGFQTRSLVVTWASMRVARIGWEAAGDGPALDRALGEVGGGVAGPGRAESVAVVWPLPVVVRGVLGGNRPRVPFAEDQHLAGEFGPGGGDGPSGVSAGAGTAGGRCRVAGAGQGRVEGAGELPGAVTGQAPEVRGAVTVVHEQVAGSAGWSTGRPGGR